MRKMVVFLVILFACPFLMSEEVVVVIEGGKSLRGEVVDENEDTLTLRLASGAEMIIERSRIQKIMTKAEVKEEFERKYAEANKESTDDLYELAKWCDKYGLRDKYEELLKAVLKLNPEHKDAKRELEILEGKFKVPTAPKRKTPKTTPKEEPKTSDKPTVMKPKKKTNTGRHKKIEWFKGGGRSKGGRKKRKGSPFKPKEWKKALEKAVGWLATNSIRVRYAPVGQIVTAGFAGLALLAAGVKPGYGQAGKKLSACISTCMRAAGLRGQENWGYGVAGMLLCEAYMVAPNESLRSAIANLVKSIEKNMLETGGFGHDGSRGPNALGYREVEIVSNWIVATMGMAKQLKIPVDKEKYAMMIEYIKKCRAGGGIGYSHTNRWPATGRTGGAVMAYACCKMWNDPFFRSMCAYLVGRMRATPYGHATPSLGYVGSALGAVQVGPRAWDQFVKQFFPKIIEHQNPDGSFKFIPNPKENIRVEENLGPAFRTAVYTLCLALDKGNLHWLSGYYGGYGPKK